jgi:phosphoglycerol transferase MdoB-like AlkP superfamily enzyme
MLLLLTRRQYKTLHELGGNMFALTILGWTLNVIWFTFLVLVWLAIAFWPARVASRKGHSFLGYFIFSLFFFPLALLVAYMVADNTVSTAAAPVSATPEV